MSAVMLVTGTGIVLIIIVLIVLVWVMLDSPYGYYDANGNFRLGHPPGEEEAIRRHEEQMRKLYSRRGF